MCWWPAWTLRVASGGYKLNFDIHRAGGLWPWAMLFVLAWSSVGFNLREESIFYDASTGVYRYSVKSDRDIRKSGITQVMFDGDTGEQLALYLPTGTANGDTIGNWLFALHMARVWGLPMQIFVCLMGLAVTALSITGVVIWLKKNRARHSGKKIVRKIQKF